MCDRPMPETPSLNLVALSVEPFWELFDEDAYFFKLFVLMFHMFDQIWSLLDPQEASFTRVFCETEAKMDKLLKKSPASVDEMRSQWNEVYQELHHEIAGELLDHNTADASADGLMAVVNAALDGNGSTLADGQAASPSSTFGPPSPPRLCRRPSFVINTDDYKGKLLDASGILSLEHVAYLDHAVPLTCQLCRWCLLYSTEVHGSSLDTLLLLAKNQSPTLLVVKDDHGNVFGGLATDEWHRATQYFGNGESFLYSFANAKTPSTGGPSSSVVTSDAGGTSVNVFTKYPWSRKNSYFMLCSEESLVMGGGGSFGLYLVRLLRCGGGACRLCVGSNDAFTRLSSCHSRTATCRRARRVRARRSARGRSWARRSSTACWSSSGGSRRATGRRVRASRARRACLTRDTTSRRSSILII